MGIFGCAGGYTVCVFGQNFSFFCVTNFVPAISLNDHYGWHTFVNALSLFFFWLLIINLLKIQVLKFFIHVCVCVYSALSWHQDLCHAKDVRWEIILWNIHEFEMERLAMIFFMYKNDCKVCRAHDELAIRRMELSRKWD